MVVGTPVANRTQVEVEQLIGFFANTLALRTRINGDPCFSEVLRAVAATHLAALDHHQMPFEKVVEAVQPERALNRNSLFQTMLVLQNFAGADGELRRHGDRVAVNMRDAPVVPVGGTAKFDLTLIAMEVADGIFGAAAFDPDEADAIALFDASAAARPNEIAIVHGARACRYATLEHTARV
ncbi:condensation domain protein [Burkholderia pseudomallei MSHR2990]|nr:condensation domain protein [Burkholderia pseudomallei MSHR2990]